MARKTRTSQIQADMTVVNGATRNEAVATYGNTARNGGGRVWTQKDGRKVASKKACRGRVHDW